MTVLPRRVVPQPRPERYPGGDCGPCVLGGLLGLTVDQVYDELLDGKVQALTWYRMREVLWAASGAGRLDRFIDDVPIWIGKADAAMPWGLPSWTQNLAWFRYLRMALDAGYYAIANVCHGRGGPITFPDHWVMIVGARERREELACDAGRAWRTEHELLVSCSSRSTPDEEWVLERDFLRDWGGFNLFLARPAT